MGCLSEKLNVKWFYKLIQWNDKRFSEDLIIGIGQDVTHENYLQNQYKNLIQNAIDIIFEVNEIGISNL
jgi:hypothetical protein